MSEVAYTPRDPVELEERKPLTPAQKLAILDRQNDLCGCGCGESLIGAVFDNGVKMCLPMIDEHIDPLWRGGKNDLSNRGLYLVPCAKAKTAREATERAKVLRLQRDHNPETRRRSKRPIRSRGFEKSDPLK